MPTSIAIILFPVVEELSSVRPSEVFTFPRMMQPETCSVFTVSEHGGEARRAKGLPVLADYRFADAPPADVILVPGGMGARAQVNNPAMAEFIARTGSAAQVANSVCTGSVRLGKAVLLTGRRGTTR